MISRSGGTRWRWLMTFGLGLLITCSACGSQSGATAGVDLGSGPLLAFIGGDGNLWMARADGTGAHAVTTTPCPATLNCYGPPSWSPDGTEVAVFAPATSGTGTQIALYNRLGLLTRTLLLQQSGTFGPLPVRWSGDGTSLALQSQVPGTPPSEAITLVDARTGQPQATLPLPAPNNVQCPDLSAGGPLGSVVDHAVNGQGGLAGIFAAVPGSTTPAYLAATISCQPQIALATSQGTQTLAPATPGALVTQAAFAPNGQSIIVTESATQGDDLFLTNAHGTDPTIVLHATETPPPYVARLANPVWSPDGSTIYFTRDAGIWAVDVSGAQAHQVVAGGESAHQTQVATTPAISPDGAHLAWVAITQTATDPTARVALMVGKSDGTGATLVATGCIWPAWS